MIEILAGKDFIFDSEEQKKITSIIKSKLELARNMNTFVSTNGIRGIGKTYALISYAQEHGYGVIVKNEGIARMLKEKYGGIFVSQDNKCFQGQCGVCDEGVDIDLCRENKINIITGFVENDKTKDTIEETNFYDEIVSNLQKEAKKLNQKLTNISNNNGDFNNYISILKSLRETLDLISKYDWKLLYSEYDVIKDNNTKQHQVSVWYQNHDNQIKDHKFWNVESVEESIINK